MKNKSLKILLILTIMLIIVLNIPSKIKAYTTLSNSIYFGVREFRNQDNGDNISYAIYNPDANGVSNGTNILRGTKIWQFVRYNNISGGNAISGNYYSIKDGVGFKNISDIAEYNISYDFYENKNFIIENNIAKDTYYNNLLSVIDLLYLDGVSTQDEKMELLSSAGINTSDGNVFLTDNDIDVVQQAVIWYFTNDENIYDNYGKKSWLRYKTLDMAKKSETFSFLKNYNAEENENGLQRQEQAEMLYNYLIEKSNSNVELYASKKIKPKRKITLYTNSTVKDIEPIILVEKVPGDNKSLDFSLRSYITKIDGVDIENSRVPNIDYSTIDSQLVAKYNHTKDPVVVKTGNTVTYNFTVYNEGQKIGRVKSIETQLPDGLTFGKINTSGFESNYDSEKNKLTITRTDNNTQNLNPYSNENLDSETIEIECVVTQTPDSNDIKTLTTASWIKEVYDAEDDTSIKNEYGDDIDLNYFYDTQVSQENDIDFEVLMLEPATFDMKLVQRVTEVNGNKVPERIEDVDVTSLISGEGTTAKYNVNKEPVLVKNGDFIKYTFRVYNEGEIDGYVSEITEEIPEGLEFVWSEKIGEDLENDDTISKEEKEAIKYNQMIWDIKSVNKDTEKAEVISTDYLAKGKGKEIVNENDNLIKAFEYTKGYINLVNDKNPDYQEISVILKVIAEDSTRKTIKNESAITGVTDSKGNQIVDRDSKIDSLVKYEDDEDYDCVILESFDLSLRKFIIAVSEDEEIEEIDYLKKANGTYLRAPIVDTSKLNILDESGKAITTAIYNHTKEPVEVSKSDYIVYMIRVYNESDIDGYASEIKDYLPNGLEYVDNDFNKSYDWKLSEDGRCVTTTYLDGHIISKTVKNSKGSIVISYKEVPIMCRVSDTARGKITSVANISVYKDENKKVINDRDSASNNVNIPTDLASYKDDESGEYIVGQEDDDDFEKVKIKSAGLVLEEVVSDKKSENIILEESLVEEEVQVENVQESSSDSKFVFNENFKIYVFLIVLFVIMFVVRFIYFKIISKE